MKYRVYVDATKKRQDGQCPVVLIFEDNGSRFKVATGLFSSAKFTGREFPEEDPNHRVKTLALSKKLIKVDEFLITNENIPFAKVKEGVKAALGMDDRKLKPLVDYIEAFAATRTASTAKFYHLTAKKVKAFDADATFETIDAKWLKKFEDHLRYNGNITINGRAIHLRDIKAVFRQAIDDEITTNYPFRKFGIKTEAVPIKNISVEQLRTLRDCDIEPNKRIFRDLFMLSFYLCGINPIDLLRLTKDNVKNERIVYTRAKTHKLYDIPLPQEAKEIISQYKGKNHLLNVLDYYGDNYLLFLKNWNKALKRMGPLGIHVGVTGRRVLRMGEPILPNITVYSARYTFASIGAELEIPRETIALCLGHSWADVTAHYISYDIKRIDDAVRKIIDYVNSDIPTGSHDE